MSGTITYDIDGWVGGGTDADGVDWVFVDSTGWFDPPAVRTAEEDKTTGDGSYSSRSYKSARVVSVFGYCKAPTEALASKARDQINALLGDGELHRLTVTEPVETRTALVRRSGGNLTPVTAKSFDYQVIMTAPDPRKYSAIVRSASTGLASSAPGGVQWNGSSGTTGVQWNGSAGSTGTVWQSAGGTTGIMTLTNAWSADAPITFSITGPITNPRLTNLATQQVLRWDGTVDSGQTLTIDTGTGSVRLGPTGSAGQNRKSQMTRTDYFSIGPFQTVAVQFHTDVFTAASATAQWRDAAM